MSKELLRHEKLFIGGEWLAPDDGDIVASIDPSSGEEWATAAFAGKADIDRAVAAANEALRGPWRKMSGTDRSNILRRLGDLYAANAGRLAELESRDNGMPIRDSRLGIASHPQYYYYYSGRCGGRDHAVERAAADRDVEAGAGAGGRLHHRDQGGGADPDHRL
jgi:aldehyde dehydrogenase (NAD+)